MFSRFSTGLRRRAHPLIVVGVALTLLTLLASALWAIPRIGSIGSGRASTARPTPGVTAPPTAAPHIVYQSDWSQGAAGWKLPPSATISGGRLTLAGTSSVSVEIPYVPKTRDYTIEMDFQILLANVGGYFGLTARNAAGDRQYLGQMQCTPMHEGAWTPAMGGCAGAVLVTARGGVYPSGLWTSDYVVHGGPQTFRLDVAGDTVNFCPVGDCLVPVTSATPLDASPHLLIEARAVKLLITRVAVIAAG